MNFEAYFIISLDWSHILSFFFILFIMQIIFEDLVFNRVEWYVIHVTNLTPLGQGFVLLLLWYL